MVTGFIIICLLVTSSSITRLFRFLTHRLQLSYRRSLYEPGHFFQRKVLNAFTVNWAITSPFFIPASSAVRTDTPCLSLFYRQLPTLPHLFRVRAVYIGKKVLRLFHSVIDGVRIHCAEYAFQRAFQHLLFGYFTFVFVLRHVHHAFEIVGKQNFLFLRRGFLAQAIPGPLLKYKKQPKITVSVLMIYPSHPFPFP